MEVEYETACSEPTGYFTAVCAVSHAEERALRCHSCGNCERWRQLRIIMNLKEKLIRYIEMPGEQRFAKYLRLWTLGTNWEDTEINRMKIKVCYVQWRKLWYKWCKRKKHRYQLLFYVIESGSSGNRLHIHFIAYGYQNWEKMISLWSSVTEIKNPNCHFSSERKTGNVSKVAFYMAKYLGKESGRRNYYYLGELIGKLPTVRNVCNSKLLGGSKCPEYIYRYIFHNFIAHQDGNYSVNKACSYLCYTILPTTFMGGIRQKRLIDV